MALGHPTPLPEAPVGETPVAVVSGLRHRYGTTLALDGMAFEVRPGELYGLIGPDGAGKTTTVRALAGLLEPNEGTVRIGGGDPLDPRSGVREHLGYMPQRFGLYRDLSVDENLRFFGDLFCLDRKTFLERRDRLMTITRLAPFLARRADALSGGMYKKLALSCALLHQPDLLILDEPTNGVDPVSRGELWDLLADFTTQGMAVLVTTSYMDEAARCSRVGLASGGRLILEGRPADLVAAFGDAVLRVEPGAGAGTDDVEATLAREGRAIEAVTPLGTGLRVVVRGADADRITARLEETTATVRRMTPGFEDLYLARMASTSTGEGP
jgi:ABC-2 type transport system ATP-binding protein